jgi:hypothetical protein
LTLNYLRATFSHKRMIRTSNWLERFFREFRSRADEACGELAEPLAALARRLRRRRCFT